MSNFLRAYTFCARNPLDEPIESYFLIKAMSARDLSSDGRGFLARHKQQMTTFAELPEVMQLISDPEYPLKRPDNIGVSLGKEHVPSQSGISTDGAEELWQELQLGNVITNAAREDLQCQKQLELRRNLVLPGFLSRFVELRVPAWRGAPFGRNVSHVTTAPFGMKPQELRAVTLQAQSPAQVVCLLHVEQWIAGTRGDHDRPLGDLSLIFAAQNQLAKELEEPNASHNHTPTPLRSDLVWR